MGLHIKELTETNFEKVIEIQDPSRHLHAFIAIHSTVMGPGLGGTRILPYQSAREALKDVLRLAKGMTYKATLANTHTGGSKSTIILPPGGKSKELFEAYAEALNYLEGKHICAEDMNCTEQDIETIHSKSPYCLGLPGNGTGDPSRFTAWGVFQAMKAVCQKLYGSDSLKGKKVLLQGIGGVGGKLLDSLFWSGADLLISDISEDALKKAAHHYGAAIVPLDEVMTTPCDLFAPCAIGGILNPTTIASLKCSAVVGGANNQLEDESCADLLMQKGILYAPDYLVNSGGLISVASPLDPMGACPKRVLEKTNLIRNRLLEIFELADKKQLSPSAAANQLVEDLLIDETKGKNVLV